MPACSAVEPVSPKNSFNLEKAVDHGVHGEKAGKTKLSTKICNHPEGDQEIENNLLIDFGFPRVPRG